MIDIELIREKPEFVKESFKRRGKEVPLTEIIDLDQRRRTAISEMDSLRARRNAVSKEIGTSKEGRELRIWRGKKMKLAID